jgi:hypothetical protein
MTRTTFLARRLSDGSTAIQCRETGDRFIIADDPFRRQSAVYCNGELSRIGSRRQCIDEIERTSRYRLSSPH